MPTPPMGEPASPPVLTGIAAVSAHVDMEDIVLRIGFGHGREAVAFVEGNEMGLRREIDRAARKALGAKAQRLGHQAMAKALPPKAGRRREATDAGARLCVRREDAQAGRKRTLHPPKQMKGFDVSPIDLGKGAALFHNEDIAAQLQEVVDRPPAQVFERCPAPGLSRRVHARQ